MGRIIALISDLKDGLHVSIVFAMIIILTHFSLTLSCGKLYSQEWYTNLYSLVASSTNLYTSELYAEFALTRQSCTNFYTLVGVYHVCCQEYIIEGRESVLLYTVVPCIILYGGQ